MNANLSRRAAALVQSPYWRWMISLRSDEDARKFKAAWTAELVEAYTFENLSLEHKKVFRLGDLSEKVAIARKLNPEVRLDLEKIVEEVLKSADS